MSSRKRTRSTHRRRSAPSQRPVSQRPGVPSAVSVEHDGHCYTVELSRAVVFDPSRPVAFLRDLLGPDQWATFRSTSPTTADVVALAAAIAAEIPE